MNENDTPKRISVSIKPVDKTDIKITNTIVEVGDAEYETYNGNYMVTSGTEDQEIPTKNKILKENVVVLKIPIWETSNDSGVTFYIGGQ